MFGDTPVPCLCKLFVYDSRFLSKIAEATGDSVEIEDIHTLVKGGVVDSSTGLAAIRNPETYRRWGASLKYNPTLIEYEVMNRKDLPQRLADC